MKQKKLFSGKRVSIPALIVFLSLVFTPLVIFGQTNWKSATNNAEFRKRENIQAIVFDNKMWVLNGTGSKLNSRDTNIISFHDTWYSTTGTNWTRAADSVPYPIASMFVALVFNGYMWVVGGHQGC